MKLEKINHHPTSSVIQKRFRRNRRLHVDTCLATTKRDAAPCKIHSIWYCYIATVTSIFHVSKQHWHHQQHCTTQWTTLACYQKWRRRRRQLLLQVKHQIIAIGRKTGADQRSCPSHSTAKWVKGPKSNSNTNWEIGRPTTAGKEKCILRPPRPRIIQQSQQCDPDSDQGPPSSLRRSHAIGCEHVPHKIPTPAYFQTSQRLK